MIDDQVDLAVAETARAWRCDLIVMTTHSSRDDADAPLGARALSAIGRTDVPVLLIPSSLVRNAAAAEAGSPSLS